MTFFYKIFQNYISNLNNFKNHMFKNYVHIYTYIIVNNKYFIKNFKYFIK